MADRSAANDWSAPGSKVSEVSVSVLSVDPAAGLPQFTLSPTGQFIGPFRLFRLIGSGGMGEVWLAEQTQPVCRRVALKLIKAGMDTGEVVERFQAERQALALMDHPGIAKVFEAGSTPGGRPYFVMEYIAGIPITLYCDRHKMSVGERLELFVRVCDAVQHAHQKAVIHRDLKPSNILVSEVDGTPTPCIIDFGVAKAISRGPNAVQFTQAGMILGTPAYMSPEQANSVGVDVDTRSDVYSLGVVLYELLVSVRPLDFQDLALDEMMRLLREEQPAWPSVRLQKCGQGSGAAAENRGSDPATLLRQLLGDLDAITLKALEKDRSRRYGSPSDLAADIGRYLRNEPVLAVPPSLAYRAGKFIRRYRGPFAAIAACVLILTSASAVSIWQSIRATSQRNRADAEAAIAQAISDFLQNDLLEQANARTQLMGSAKADPDLKVRTVLDRAAARIAGRFERQPEIEAALRNTIGRTYLDLGLYREGSSQFDRALELLRRSLGEENPKTLITAGFVAGSAVTQGRYAEAERLFNQVLKIQRRVLGSAHPDTLASMAGLATVYRERGKYPEAEDLFSQLSQVGRRVWGAEGATTLTCMDRLADVCYREGKYAQAEELDVRVLEIRRRVLGPQHPDTTVSMGELANVHAAQGKFAAAEALNREILEIRRQVLGPEHPFTLAAMNNLAVVSSNRGKYAQAEGLNRQALEIRRRVLGPESSETLMSMENLACSYSDRKKYPEAEALFAQTLEIERRVMGIESRFTLNTLSDATFMFQREGKYAQAEKNANEVLAAWRHALGSESTVTMEAAADVVTAQLSLGKFVESESLAREVQGFYRKNRPEDWQRFRAESLLGGSLAGQKNFPEAEPLLLEGYRGMLERKDRIAFPDWYHLDRARERIVHLYSAWGEEAKAAEWRRNSPPLASRPPEPPYTPPLNKTDYPNNRKSRLNH